MNLSVMFTQDKISRLSKINYWSLNTAAVSLNPFETIKFRYKWDLPCNSGGDEIFAQVIKSVLHQILRQITNLVSPEGCREIKQNQSHVLYWNVDFSKKKKIQQKTILVIKHLLPSIAVFWWWIFGGGGVIIFHTQCWSC